MAREVAIPLELEEERPEPRRRLRKTLQTARRHPLGVFGLMCVSLLFFCGIFADLIVPYDPIATIREARTFGTLAEQIDETDDRLKVEWIVRAPKGAMLNVTARHERAGTARTELHLD